MELVRQYPELWSQLNALTLANSVDWPAVLRALDEIDKPPTVARLDDRATVEY